MSDEGLRGRVEEHVTRASGEAATVRALERLAGGACQENFAVTLALPAGETRMVLRSDASSSLPGSIDRAREHDVIGAAVSANVRTPAAKWLARGLLRESASAYFLDWVDGEAIGRRVVGSPKLAAAREKLPRECAIELAKIHSVTPKTHPSLFDAPPPEDPAREAVARLERDVDSLKDPRPAMELVLRWLRENAPPAREITLVHGDFRTGNFMVTEAGLSGVLDWEFSHWGSPAEDVAWMCVRDWRFGQLKLAAGGFATRAKLYEEYARARGGGYEVDPREIHYWEVMGNARWGTASLHQGERYLSGADADIELVAVARRAIEMEYEALRIIEELERGRG